jgi:hypothetical protein
MNDDDKAILCAVIALPIIWGFIFAVFALADTF